MRGVFLVATIVAFLIVFPLTLFALAILLCAWLVGALAYAVTLLVPERAARGHSTSFA